MINLIGFLLAAFILGAVANVVWYFGGDAGLLGAIFIAAWMHPGGHPSV